MGTGPSAAARSAPPAGELPAITSELLRDLEALPLKQRRFVLEWFACRGNSTEAYRRAYGVTRNADVLGPRLLGTDRVRGIIQKHAKRQEEEKALTAEAIDLERRRIAKVDPRRLCASDGRPLGLHELDEDTARAVAKVKFKVVKVVRGPKAAAAVEGIGVPAADAEGRAVEEVSLGTVEYAFHSKNEALAHGDKVLGRHVERHELVGPANVTINIGVRKKKPAPSQGK